jgi:hypothetical protein
MRHYTAEDERRVRLQADVRTWTRSGLIDAAQCSRIEETLRTGLKRTPTWLRLALAGFTAIVIAASIALVFVVFHLTGDIPIAVLLTLAALVCFATADYLAGVVRLYRYGVEETLASAAPLLLGIATLAFANSGGRVNTHLDAVAALIVAAASSFVVYRRFGFVYAAAAATVLASLVPFPLDLSDAAQRTAAAAICGAVFFTARALHVRDGDDFPGDEYASLQAVACAGAYVYLNLRLPEIIGHSVLTAGTLPSVPTWFYWLTYAAVWSITGAVLATAVRDRDRPLLAVAIVLALVTLVTNKPYLGIARQSWDPMLLGGALVGGSIALRRWLAAGPGGARRGYTADAIARRHDDLLRVGVNTSVAWQGRVYEQPAPAPADTGSAQFGGGRSGGGGGSAGY